MERNNIAFYLKDLPLPPPPPFQLISRREGMNGMATDFFLPLEIIPLAFLLFEEKNKKRGDEREVMRNEGGRKGGIWRGVRMRDER